MQQLPKLKTYCFKTSYWPVSLWNLYSPFHLWEWWLPFSENSIFLTYTCSRAQSSQSIQNGKKLGTILDIKFGSLYLLFQFKYQILDSVLLRLNCKVATYYIDAFQYWFLPLNKLRRRCKLLNSRGIPCLFTKVGNFGNNIWSNQRILMIFHSIVTAFSFCSITPWISCTKTAWFCLAWWYLTFSGNFFYGLPHLMW